MFRYFIMILIFCLTALEARAQDPNLKVDEIINQYIEALGGRERLQAVNSMKINGLHFYRGLEYSMTILSQRPNLFRLELVNEDGQGVSVFDGKTAWEMRDPATAREMRDPRNKIFMQMNDDFEGALIGYKAKGHKVELAGVENIDGKQAYKLHITLSNGRAEDWYIDRSSFLLLKRSTTFKRGNREFENSLFFMDYRKVDGLMIPHYIERVYEPHYVRGYEFTKIEINPELDAKLFRIQTVSEKSTN